MRTGSLMLALGACTAAIVGGAAFGATVLVPDDPAPASTALDVSRRADPSLDRYLRTPSKTTPATSMNGAQTWLSEHAAPLVAHDSDPTVSLNTTGWATKPDVSVYVNATGVNLFNRAARQSASRWLVRKGETPVKVDGWLMLDIRQAEARRWWLYGSDDKATCHAERERRAALDLIACGYRGLWVDNVLTVPSQWFKPDPGIDAAEWGEALVTLLRELRDGLPQGVPFVINAHWTDLDYPYAPSPILNPAAPLVRAAQLADQLVIEGGAIDPGLNYAGALGDEWSYRRLLTYADALHGAGVKVQWEKTGSTDLTRNASDTLGYLPSCRDGDLPPPQPAWKTGDRVWRAHVRTAAFNLGSALLTFRTGDSVGDMCEYPGRGWTGYGQDLGTPLGERQDSGPVLLRRFERGLVAVNPSSTPVSITLPDGRTAVDLASTADPKDPVVTTGKFLIQPRSALMARYVAEP